MIPAHVGVRAPLFTYWARKEGPGGKLSGHEFVFYFLSKLSVQHGVETHDPDQELPAVQTEPDRHPKIVLF